MDIEEQIDRIIAAHAASDSPGFGQGLSELIEHTSRLPLDAQHAALEIIATAFEHEQPDLAANLALACGALVEKGAPVEALARAIAKPITHHVQRAAEFVAFAELEAPVKEGELGGLWLGSHSISQASLEQLHAKHPVLAASFQSLEVWFRPVVALWSRCRSVLNEQRQNTALGEGLKRVSAVSSAHWIRVLLGDTFEDPFIILAPESNAGFEVVLDGVCDCGQLAVLFAGQVPLDSIGVTKRPSEAMIAVMSGEGPQQTDASYESDFHFYAWNAMNPATGMPEKDRFTWQAPGGSGSHSLPADFQPSAIEVLQGRRVLLVVGPNAEAALFRRVIPGTRSFGVQSATINVTSLSAEEIETWTEHVKSACR